jgi:hypothetical protein
MIMSKKRSRTVFDAVEQLDSQDVKASRKRKSSSAKQLRQSMAAKSQTKLHGKLMECRILLQRVLGETKDEDGDSAEQACNQLLAQLFSARSQLRGDDDSRNSPDYSQVVESDERLEEVLQSEYSQHKEEWKTVLNQKHKDLRLHAGLTAKSQFRVMDSTFWQQVESTVSHEELRQRAEQQDESSTGVFDDSKVYGNMLQDFLLSSKGGVGAEEAAAERLRRAMKDSKSNKKKKEVDRRASKGRKIRYNVIPKLVNFTFPVSRPVAGMMDDEDGWFKSLFGGAANQKK